MRRIACTVVAIALICASSAADEKKPAAVNFSGSLEDRDLMKEAPEGGVIATQKAWEKLAKAWGIKDAPKVDFDNQILFVVTSVGSQINIGDGKLNDKGDLAISAEVTDDLRPGFRYKIKSFSRAGVKTVNGKPLPKG
jgi:hypothetical protein